MKFLVWLFCMGLVGALTACGSSATPTAQPPTATLSPTATVAPTATLEPPTATPTPSGPQTTSAAPTPTPPSETADSQLVDISSDHPAALLSLLPADSLLYAFVNLETVAERPDLAEQVEFQLGHFVSTGELPLADELLIAVGARALVLSSFLSSGEWACILQGDFGRVGDALGEGAASGAGLSVSIVDTHRSVDIFGLVRTRESGGQSEIYLAILSPDTLAASPDLDGVRAIVDRQLDGGVLPKTLARLVEDWGLSDFLQAFVLRGIAGNIGPPGSPLNLTRISAFHGTLSEDSTTTLRGLQQYDNEEQVEAATDWLNEQTEARWRDIGWGRSAVVDRWQSKGPTVYGEVLVPDEDVPAVVQGN